jgi:hypothetical protein
MCLHRSLSGVMAKTFFEYSMRNFTQQPFMSHFSDKVTPECLLLAATGVKHSLGNCAGGSFLRVVFEADTYKGMQNSVLDIHI